MIGNYCATCAMRDDVPHTGREASRLTDVDREAMDARLCEILAGWAMSTVDRRYTPVAGDVVAMTRAMAHAIGCTVADLRVCELEEIHGKACATVGATYDAAGRWMLEACPTCDGVSSGPRNFNNCPM